MTSQRATQSHLYDSEGIALFGYLEGAEASKPTPSHVIMTAVGEACLQVNSAPVSWLAAHAHTLTHNNLEYNGGPATGRHRDEPM